MWYTRRFFLALSLIATVVLTACGGAAAPEPTAGTSSEPTAGTGSSSGAAGTSLEIFSWWTGSGEAEGLAGMFDAYKKTNPDVEIINAAVSGGAGSNAKAVLKTRMLGGQPPDSFQVHGGQELTDTWVKTNYMEPVDDIFAEAGLDKFPKDLIDIVSYEGKAYSIPVNVHRGNVLWANQELLTKAGVETLPTTFEEFFAAAEKLKAAGVTPLALGDKDKWAAGHLFETVLVGELGAQGYRDLYTGKLSFDDAKVKQAIETFGKMVSYANEDHAAMGWDQAAQLLVDGKAAFTIMGDWADGFFKAKGWTPGKEFVWAPAPGNQDVFIVVTDTFGLPKNAPNPENAKAWLRVAASKEGQEAFNPQKGSICARTDCDLSLFDDYLKSSAADFQKNALVPSTVHGSAAPEGFVTGFNDAVNIFVTTGDVDTAATMLVQAAKDAKFAQ